MIIIYQEIKDGKITLTKEEFEKYLESAFYEGFGKGCDFVQQRFVFAKPNYDKTYDNDAYEKMPYWMRPDYKAPSVTCSTKTPKVTYSTDGCCTDGYINMLEYEKTMYSKENNL